MCCALFVGCIVLAGSTYLYGAYDTLHANTIPAVPPIRTDPHSKLYSLKWVLPISSSAFQTSWKRYVCSSSPNQIFSYTVFVRFPKLDAMVAQTCLEYGLRDDYVLRSVMISPRCDSSSPWQ